MATHGAEYAVEGTGRWCDGRSVWLAGSFMPVPEKNLDKNTPAIKPDRGKKSSPYLKISSKKFHTDRCLTVAFVQVW